MFYKKLKQELRAVKAELQATNAKLEQTQLELMETQKFLAVYRSTKNARALIEDATSECMSKSDINRLRLLEKTINDINYRSYITKTKSGKICIDIHQVPLSDKEVSALLEA